MFNFHSDASGIETQSNFAVVFVVCDFVSFREREKKKSRNLHLLFNPDWNWDIDSFIWLSDKMNLCWTRKLSYYFNGPFYILHSVPSMNRINVPQPKISARWTMFNLYDSINKEERIWFLSQNLFILSFRLTRFSSNISTILSTQPIQRSNG